MYTVVFIATILIHLVQNYCHLYTQSETDVVFIVTVLIVIYVCSTTLL